jgi:hypothetical protein
MQILFYGILLLTLLACSFCMDVIPSDGAAAIHPSEQQLGNVDGSHRVESGAESSSPSQSAPVSEGHQPVSQPAAAISTLPADSLDLARRMREFFQQQDQERFEVERTAASRPPPRSAIEDNLGSGALSILRGFENLFAQAAAAGVQGSAAAPPPFVAPPSQELPPPPPPAALSAQAVPRPSGPASGEHVSHGPAVGMQDLGAFLAGIFGPRQQLQQGQLLGTGVPLGSGGAPPLASDLPAVQAPFWAHLYGPSLARFEHQSIRGIGPEQIRMPHYLHS